MEIRTGVGIPVGQEQHQAEEGSPGHSTTVYGSYWHCILMANADSNANVHSRAVSRKQYSAVVIVKSCTER